MTQKVAYLTSRFPKITETFILYEILELERQGLSVEVFSLVREHEQVIHAEAREVVEQAHFSPFLSGAVLAAQLYWLVRRPGAYLRVWWQAIRGNLSSHKFLVRALALVPQAGLFARQMQELGVTHLHAHWATHPALSAYVIRQLTGIPYSFTAHAHDIYVERPMLEEKIRQSSFVVVKTKFNQQLLHDWYGATADEKTAVIHYGNDLSVFKPRPAKDRRGPFTIVCVASLQDYKGHPYLIDACALLKERGINFRCLCVGEGEDRPQLEAQIAERGLQEQVLLLGHQPRDRVAEIIAEADVMAMPSIITNTGKMEGLPLVLQEALATELPVVATAISGIPELIEHERTGLLVQERDAPALAAALQRIHDDPVLGQQLGAAGREKVLNEFDLRTNVAALRRLLVADWTSKPTSARGPFLTEVLSSENEEA